MVDTVTDFGEETDMVRVLVGDHNVKLIRRSTKAVQRRLKRLQGLR
jgi:hypothetical protein